MKIAVFSCVAETGKD